jgi:ribulose-phosphate 3-epimerase
MNMVQIIPAILATSEEEYKIQLQKIEGSNLFESGWVHIDLMDNIFVQNRSIWYEELRKYPSKLKKEAHLMVQSPTGYITRLSLLRFDRIVFHSEVGNVEHVINQIKPRHMEVGIALNPETPVSKVESILKDIDVLLIMSVHPGRQGQEFMPAVSEKVKEASHYRLKNNLSFKIEVDGGINKDNVKAMKDAGADCLVIGSHLLKGNIGENLELIWEELA